MPLQRPSWIQQMLHDSALRNSFFATCDKLSIGMEALMEKAVESGDPTLAASALGKKKGIELMRSQITMYLQEDLSNAEHDKQMEEESGRTDEQGQG